MKYGYTSIRSKTFSASAQINLLILNFLGLHEMPDWLKFAKMEKDWRKKKKIKKEQNII